MESRQTLIAKIMKKYTIPSLKYQVLLRIVACLWNRKNVRNRIGFMFHTSNNEYFEEVLSGIRNDINHLPIQTALKIELLRFNEGISWEILKWNLHHNLNYRLSIIMPENVCWKPSGTINYEKTARLLIQDSTLPVFKRLFLSYMYGLEDSIKELKPLSTEEDSYQILSTDAYFLSYWADVLTLDSNSIDNLPIHLLRISAIKAEIFVCEYMFKKINPESKKILVTVFEEITTIIYKNFLGKSFQVKFSYADVLCWLLDKLEKKEQKRMLKKHPFPVLFSYLEWPRQRLFLKLAHYLFKYLSGKDFGYLLKEIAYKKNHHPDYDYEAILGKFWFRSLAAHKEYAIGAQNCWPALYHLFMIGNTKHIEKFFEHTTDENKEKFLNSIWGKRIKLDLRRKGKNDLLHFLEH
ncbi:uncharacterized protein NPIL_685981 [Nephila pilipes]|uniref:Uncharacterized protein n=1 Tax=Nephila pilipes TaxID=299642 RepID=A0A8X6UNQ0_NEPPI|nr:uncharacterized protein NPIL_685981 [Nephila pilipes]